MAFPLTRLSLSFCVAFTTCTPLSFFPLPFHPPTCLWHISCSSLSVSCAPALSLSHILSFQFSLFGSAAFYFSFRETRTASQQPVRRAVLSSFSGVSCMCVCACTHSGIYPDNVSVLVLCASVFYISLLDFEYCFCILRFHFLLPALPVLSPPLAFSPKMVEGQSAICTQPLPYHANLNVLEGLSQQASVRDVR